MYLTESPRCKNKNCSAWMPPFPEVVGSNSFELECPACKQRHSYKRQELFLPRPMPGTPSDGPQYKQDMRWQRVWLRSEDGIDAPEFFVFVSENDPVAPALAPLATL
jgi:hypothetical protein